MGQAFLVCKCVNERARIPVGADSISAREVCGGRRGVGDAAPYMGDLYGKRES